MSTPVPSAAIDERALYPLHEEDEVTEIPFHERQVRYLRDVIATCFPDWFVTGNVGVYWEQGNYTLYVAPDLFVVREPLPEPDPRVYLLWRDPPILFAAEISSRSTQKADEGPKVTIYSEHVRAAEYLYADPPNGVLHLWRRGAQGYEPVAPTATGRRRSAELELEFGLEGDFLRVYTLNGEPLRTHQEAEQQVAREARRRAQAEARVREEARRRREAEARARELERQLAELRARLGPGE